MGTVLSVELLCSVNEYMAEKGHPLVEVGQRVMKFFRIDVNNTLYSSKEYTRVKKRNSFTICYNSKGSLRLAQILYFVEAQGCGFAIGKDYGLNGRIALPPQLTSSVFPVIEDQDLKLFSVDLIIRKCVYVNYDNSEFVCVPPFDILVD